MIGTAFVFLMIANPGTMEHSIYFNNRNEILKTYCDAVLVKFRSLTTVVGIAMDHTVPRSSETIIHVTSIKWTESDFELAEDRRLELGILENLRINPQTEYEFPIDYLD